AAARLARDGLAARQFGAPTLAHAKRCLLDYLSCAFEALPLPWSEQAAALAPAAQGGAHVIGRAGPRQPDAAAFAPAVAGHGPVRDDLSVGRVSPLGLGVRPVVCAVSHPRGVSGAQGLDAAIVGYDPGARLGRAVIAPDLARLFRPTGLVGPFAAAMAGARLHGFDEARTLYALALAGKC